MKQFVENLTEDQLKDLMYHLSRSGRVVIPNWFTAETIRNMYKNDEEIDIDNLSIKDIQLSCEGDERVEMVLHEAVLDVHNQPNSVDFNFTWKK